MINLALLNLFVPIPCATVLLVQLQGFQYCFLHTLALVSLIKWGDCETVNHGEIKHLNSGYIKSSLLVKPVLGIIFPGLKNFLLYNFNQLSYLGEVWKCLKNWNQWERKDFRKKRRERDLMKFWNWNLQLSP